MEKPRLCSDCGTQTEWKEVEQEYKREGIRVRLGGLPAMACPQGGSISLTPDTTEHIFEAANAFFKLANDRHKAVLTGVAVD
jgi:hypothetical protein